MDLIKPESTYIYELSEVDRSIEDLRSQLPYASDLLYSVKANPHPDVVKHAAMQGVGLEVSSEGELEVAAAARTAANASTEIVCTGPGKTHAYLKLAAEKQAIISIESDTELTDLKRLGISGQSLLVRINASVSPQRSGLQMTGTASPFGIDENNATPVVRRLIDEGHNFRGVHLYMGSNILEENDLIRQFEISTRIAIKYATYGSGDFIADLGGGFGHPFAVPGAAPRWPGMRKRLEKITEPLLARNTRITFESGRYLVGGCGTLRARVLDVKSSKGERFVVLSSGVNHLGGLSGLKRLPRARFSAGSETHCDQSERLVGPLCTPVDVLNKQSSTEFSIGDDVEVPNVGAYGLTASLLGFLSHPCPPEEIRLNGDIIRTTQIQLSNKEMQTP